MSLLPPGNNNHVAYGNVWAHEVGIYAVTTHFYLSKANRIALLQRNPAMLL